MFEQPGSEVYESGWSGVIQYIPLAPFAYLLIFLFNLAPLSKSPSTGAQLQSYIT